ncbi:hypothetical protein ED236_00360 [Pseudomethylobacillus aquaticus]|uniref:Uncharacterized protein n=1 Tax=Pseudomethylobacillus aquaticus TaxID=2676064 RepID=A0A3N0V5X8_9PROT|nr:hypothetical protein ED236_00360 [Pseudomethylobacillus aquaticus]
MTLGDRTSHLHCARVYIAQSRHFSRAGHRDFAFLLLQWAGDQRRQAAATKQEGLQIDLFACVS